MLDPDSIERKKMADYIKMRMKEADTASISE